MFERVSIVGVESELKSKPLCGSISFDSSVSFVSTGIDSGSSCGL